VRCVHARADDRVPFAQSVTYVAAARAAGQDARLLEVDGDHYTVADASSPAWPAVITALEELMGPA
jgi:dipeptidyl aminopeptidase/acylaminoacyl peptidase